MNSQRAGFGTALYFALMFCLAVYFTFAAVQGNFGLFHRAQINAQSTELQATLAQLEDSVAVLKNKTHRLSDDFMDIDLLDEQARSVLGMLRSDELVIR